MILKSAINLVWITFIIIASPCLGNDSKLELSPEEKSWLGNIGENQNAKTVASLTD